MKGKKISEILTRKQVVKAGSVLLAAIVLGTGAWVTDMQVKDQVPELTTFVDVDELVSIGEEEVPLASAPKVTVKTKKTTKVVRLKQKATKTTVKKKTTKKTSTKKKISSTATTTTKVETTTLVTEKYKKGSNKKTVLTTKKIKTTVTVMELATAKSAETANAATPVTVAGSTQTSTQQEAQETGVVEISKIAPLVDTRIKSAYEALGFTVEINPGVSYSGYFTAREQKITLRRNDDTIYHELGHFLAFVAGNVDTKSEFMAVYQEEKDLMESVRKAYAIQNSSEYFAESFREYTLDPVTLKNKRPKTYQSIVNALNVVTETQTSRILAVYGAFWKNNK